MCEIGHDPAKISLMERYKGPSKWKTHLHGVGGGNVERLGDGNVERLGLLEVGHALGMCTPKKD